METMIHSENMARIGIGVLRGADAAGRNAAGRNTAGRDTVETDTANTSQMQRETYRTGCRRKKNAAGRQAWRILIIGLAIWLGAELCSAVGLPVAQPISMAAGQIRKVLPQEKMEKLQNFLNKQLLWWAAGSLPVCQYSVAAATGEESTKAAVSATAFTDLLLSEITDSSVLKYAFMTDKITTGIAETQKQLADVNGGAEEKNGSADSGQSAGEDSDEEGKNNGNGSGEESGENGSGEGENSRNGSEGNGSGADENSGKGSGEGENGGNGSEEDGSEGRENGGNGSEEDGSEEGENSGNDNRGDGSGGRENDGNGSGEDGSVEGENSGNGSGEDGSGKGENSGNSSGENATGEEDPSLLTEGSSFVLPSVTGTLYTAEMLTYSFLTSNFYNISSSTVVYESELNGSLLEIPLTLSEITEEPQILIYHTHSHEFFADSDTSDLNTGIVGVGNYLAELLESYGYSVLHLTDQFDYVDGVLDRSKAYTYAGTRLKEVLAGYPSIEVMIDLHRDGVDDELHLVTEINGKSTAMIMFFNGMSRTTSGNISYLPNENLTENLAFSLQLKVKAEAYYPGFTRKSYIKPYRYNLHLLEKALLIEAGAQTNTFEEVKNAMEPLAALLHMQLSGAE